MRNEAWHGRGLLWRDRHEAVRAGRAGRTDASGPLPELIGTWRRGDDMAVNIPTHRQICREPQTTFGMDTSDYP
ncbi:hypothetical protein Spla01_04734 [Streptomyces platensis]